ncbi:hypothetical protein BS47DRAFT_1332579 [Hydnum rufescens UP504]|uniref:Uncharacterized protein n=1 Tax=Hydnum rufescens UP504 TaxID=1448309 RepID=A0A9P6AMP1_9AGAM|nr:hypothetical protein BS47DRAFT_1332579 [Hydnum rufescens UP504]
MFRRSLCRGPTLVVWGARAPISRTRYRLYSNEVPQRQRSPPSQSPARDEPAHQYYSESLQHALTVVGRFFKFAAVGGLGLGLAVAIAWEGAHQWVEYHELASVPQTLPDPFEWGLELERWTGPRGNGGTHSRLGWKGRHFVRAAWISLNWAFGTDASIIQASRPGAADSIALNDEALVKALVYLDSALAVANHKAEMSREDGTMDQTILDLHTLRASVLARIGDPHALKSASSIYNLVYDALLREGRTSDAARMAVKLGDISARLNHSDTAIGWWKKAVELIGAMINNPAPKHASSRGSEEYLPRSPYSQRILMSALVSLSGHYATSRKFRDTLATDFAMFTITPELLGRALKPSSPALSSVEGSKSLHYSFILHRDALLRIHAAEVFYALRDPSRSSDTPVPLYLTSLQTAISSSEAVIRLLTQGPSATPIPSPTSAVTPTASPAPLAPLSPKFASSPLLSAPSEVLLRQAKRTATHAHNLTGIVLEEQGDTEQALDHFERALEWAGGREGHDERHAIQSEWKSVWVNYVRAREAVLNKVPSENKT